MNSVAPRSPSTSRLEFIDCLRGFACLWVVLCHVQSYWMADMGSGTGLAHVVVAVCRLGSVGVDLFVVLSGFCLYWPVVRKPDGPATFSPGVFFRRRIRRIVPAYYAAIVFALILIWIPAFHGRIVSAEHRLDWVDVLTNALFVQNWLPGHIGTINGSFWSLALEAQLYLIFPLLVWLAGHRPGKAFVRVAVPVMAAWQILELYVHHRQWNWSAIFFEHEVPVRLTQFTAGMIAAGFVARPRRGQTAVAAALFIVFSAAVAVSTKRQPHPYSALHYLLLAGAFGPLVVLLSAVDGSWFQSPLRVGLLTRLGLMSYSLYLIHQPTMLAVHLWVEPLHLGRMQTLGFFMGVVLPPMILLAYGFFRLFERPFMTAARRPKPNLTEPAVAIEAAP